MKLEPQFDQILNIIHREYELKTGDYSVLNVEQKKDLTSPPNLNFSQPASNYASPSRDPVKASDNVSKISSQSPKQDDEGLNYKMRFIFTLLIEMQKIIWSFFKKCRKFLLIV